MQNEAKSAKTLKNSVQQRAFRVQNGVIVLFYWPAVYFVNFLPCHLFAPLKSTSSYQKSKQRFIVSENQVATLFRLVQSY